MKQFSVTFYENRQPLTTMNMITPPQIGDVIYRSTSYYRVMQRTFIIDDVDYPPVYVVVQKVKST